ncbi:MAG: hypothetical protein CMK07_03485 [Ponticaulis sp.]|nr:hypothetical protein [Ponticaulis sp.]
MSKDTSFQVYENPCPEITDEIWEIDVPVRPLDLDRNPGRLSRSLDNLSVAQRRASFRVLKSGPQT